MAATEHLNAPFLFNPLKHHLDFIRSYIRSYEHKDYDRLKSDLLKIGESQMDLYLGELSIGRITKEIMAFLTNSNLLEKEPFFQHLDKHGGFVKISLSDQSTWVLRRGEDPNSYIHIHPARYGKHSIRVKATTLKSIIAVTIIFNYTPSIGLDELNKVRVKILDLSPIKYISENTLKILDMLSFVNQ